MPEFWCEVRDRRWGDLLWDGAVEAVGPVDAEVEAVREYRAHVRDAYEPGDPKRDYAGVDEVSTSSRRLNCA